MSFVRPTPAEILSRISGDIEASLAGADPRQRRSVESVIARVITLASHELHGHLAWAAQQLFVDTADADILQRQAAIWGIARRSAVIASGSITVSGTVGVVLPSGSEFRRSDDERYVTTADATVGAGGTVAVVVNASVAGSAANAALATTFTLVAPVAGIQSAATVTTAVTGGLDIESDDSLRQRVLDRIQSPPQGGSSADYQAWTRSKIGGDAVVWTKPLYTGAGTVTVFCMKGDGSLPSAGELVTIQSYIDTVRPVTATVTVLAPATQAVNVSIALNPNTAAAKAAVIAELNDFFIRESDPGGTIRVSRLREAISIAAGEVYHQLTAPAADVVMPAGTIARLGTQTWI